MSIGFFLLPKASDTSGYMMVYHDSVEGKSESADQGVRHFQIFRDA
jgi:hypothetical protein